MVNLGILYKSDHGVATDMTQTDAWYCKATEVMNSKGMHRLDTMYKDGDGVIKDEAQAVAWYPKKNESLVLTGIVKQRH